MRRHDEPSSLIGNMKRVQGIVENLANISWDRRIYLT